MTDRQVGVRYAERNRISVRNFVGGAMVRGQAWTGFEAAALQEAMRCSVRDFAALLGVETTTVANWRSGLSGVRLRSATQAILDTALSSRATDDDRARFEQLVAEGEAAWRECRRRAARKARTTTADGRGPYDEQASSPNPQADALRRIDFLTGLVAATASVLTDDIIEAATSSIDQLPARVGMDHVDRVRGWASVLRSADDAGLAVGDGMVVQLRSAVDHLRSDMAPTVRREMYAAVGTLFRVVGWAHYDRGNHGSARANFRAGLHCAEQAEAWWLRAAVLTCVARQAIYLGRPDDALMVLGAAGFRADRLSLLRRADIAAVQVRAFAALGNSGECARAVESAEQFFAESLVEDHPDTEHEGFADYYSATLLGGDIAQGIFDLAYYRDIDVHRAIDRFEAAIQLPAEQARSRTLSSIRLSALHLRYGDPDEGVAVALRAMEATPGTRSARIVDSLRLLDQAADGEQARRARGGEELRCGIIELIRTR